MVQWRAHLDRYQATKNPQLILDPNVIAQVRELRDWALGSATLADAEHLRGWYHWLRYQSLGDRDGAADRQAAEGFFRSRYQLRSDDLPQLVRQRIDAEFQQRYADAVRQVDEQNRRRRPNRQQLHAAVQALTIVFSSLSLWASW
jgi:hypothetical protein